MRGFAELYRQGAARDMEMVMSRIESESRRMGLLIDDLLLLARLDAQRPIERKLVDLLALATDAVHDARAVSPNRTITIEVVDGPGTPEVLGDEARLRQVLGNLMTNALQHTPETAHITVRVGTSAEDAILEVVDEGPGMSEEDALRVFERFYRTDSSRARSSGGSGLGLSIVDSLVHAHGGTRERDHGARAGLPLLRQPAAYCRRARTSRISQPLTQLGKCRFDFRLRLVEGFRRRVAIDVGEAEIAEAASREDVDVQVRHLEPGDDHPGAVGIECPADGLADQLGDGHDPAEHRRVDVLPLIDLGSRHHQRVSLGHRLDGQEGDDLVVLVDEPARQFAVDDPGEDSGHRFSICCAANA